MPVICDDIETYQSMLCIKNRCRNNGDDCSGCELTNSCSCMSCAPSGWEIYPSPELLRLLIGNRDKSNE